MKQILLTVALCLLIAPGYSEPIYDSDTSANGNTNQIILSHTVAAKTDRLLIVWLGYLDSNSGSGVSGVTANGSAMTEILNDEQDFQLGISAYYFIAPNIGVIPVTITMVNSNPIVAASVSFYGVDQNDPFGDTFAHTDPAGASGPDNHPVTTVSDASVLVDACFLATDDEIPSANSGQTPLWSENTSLGAPDATNQAGAGGYELVGAAGEYTVSYDWSATKKHSFGIIEIIGEGRQMRLGKYW